MKPGGFQLPDGRKAVIDRRRFPGTSLLRELLTGLRDDRVGSGHPGIDNVGDSSHGVALEYRTPRRGTNNGAGRARVEDVGASRFRPSLTVVPDGT